MSWRSAVAGIILAFLLTEPAGAGTVIVEGKIYPESLPMEVRDHEIHLPALVLARLLGLDLEYRSSAGQLCFKGNGKEIPLTPAQWREEKDGRIWVQVRPVAERFGWRLVQNLARQVLSLGKEQVYPVLTAADLAITPETITLRLSATGSFSYHVYREKTSNQMVVELGAYGGDLPPATVEKNGIRVSLRWRQEGERARGTVTLSGPLFGYRFTQSAEGVLTLEIPLYIEERLGTAVAPGLVYRRIKRNSVAGPIVIDVLEANLREPSLKVRPVLADGSIPGVQAVSRMAEQQKAIAAVNGGYFSPYGDILGVLIIDGEMISAPLLPRTALALAEDGRAEITRLDFSGRCFGPAGMVIPVNGVNRYRRPGEIVVYTPAYGKKTGTKKDGREWVIRQGVVTAISSGNTEIPRDGWVLSAGTDQAPAILLREGDPVVLELRTIPDWREMGWRHVIGGGPRLLEGGQIRITAEEEDFKPDVTVGRAPRTAIGLRPDGTMVVVTVSGRQDKLSIGMTLEELAHLLQDLGCTEGMNLDGGGSSVMIIRNRVFNYPSDGRERPVGSAILFFSDGY